VPTFNKAPGARRVRRSKARAPLRESGGPPVKPPGRKGFGTRLIEGGLAQELDGEVSLQYEPAGVLCKIVMPIPTGNGWMNHA